MTTRQLGKIEVCVTYVVGTEPKPGFLWFEIENEIMERSAWAELTIKAAIKFRDQLNKAIEKAKKPHHYTVKEAAKIIADRR